MGPPIPFALGVRLSSIPGPKVAHQRALDVRNTRQVNSSTWQVLGRLPALYLIAFGAACFRLANLGKQVSVCQSALSLMLQAMQVAACSIEHLV